MGSNYREQFKVGGREVAVFDGNATGRGSTSFFALCLDYLIFDQSTGAQPPPRIAEFGSGTGSAVIETLAKHTCPTTVFGVEIDKESVDVARTRIADANLEERYTVINGDFFEQPPAADCLIACPAALPTFNQETAGPADTIDEKTLSLLKQIDGGPTGSELSRKLLRLDYAQVMMLVMSFADPIAILGTAREHGYYMEAWLSRPAKLGSLARRVLPVIHDLQGKHQAFLLPDSEIYLMFGVLWTKSYQSQAHNTERSLVACLEGLYLQK